MTSIDDSRLITESSHLEVEDLDTETSSSAAAAKPKNTCKAVLAINFAALCDTGMLSVYKMIAKDGFRQADFCFYRNLVGLAICTLWCCLDGIKNPFKEFPYRQKWNLLGRCIAGSWTQ